MSFTPQQMLRNDLEIKTALISVSDKTGVVEFAKGLESHGVRIVATGGTFRALQEAGVDVKPLSELAPFPEILGGRVKTLQPQIFGGILADKANQEHMDQLKNLDLSTIDMVVCNLYPFEEVARKKDVTMAELLENIDIGGHSLIRAAAKNHPSVCVVTEARHYPWVLDEMNTLGGKVSYETRQNFAERAFALTAEYDTYISLVLTNKFREDETTRPQARSRSR